MWVIISWCTAVVVVVARTTALPRRGRLSSSSSERRVFHDGERASGPLGCSANSLLIYSVSMHWCVGFLPWISPRTFVEQIFKGPPFARTFFFYFEKFLCVCVCVFFLSCHGGSDAFSPHTHTHTYTLSLSLASHAQRGTSQSLSLWPPSSSQPPARDVRVE